MPSVTSRRFLGQVVRLVGRPWNDVTRELQEFLQKLVDSTTNGIPGGFQANTPPTVLCDGDADPGTENAAWMASNAQLVVGSEVPLGLANAAVQGTSTKVANAGHQHKRDVRVALNGSDVGTRNRLNIVDSASVSALVVDDAGNDEIDITLESPAAEDAEYLAWVL
jgi:hypothetical protein